MFENSRDFVWEREFKYVTHVQSNGCTFLFDNHIELYFLTHYNLVNGVKKPTP